MPAEFHVSIFDEDRAQREHKRGDIGFSFSGMTEPQRDLLITILNRTVRGLEEHRPKEEEEMMSLRKTGSGKILGEDQDKSDLQKTATGWTQQDLDGLAAEMTEEERRAARDAQ